MKKAALILGLTLASTTLFSSTAFAQQQQSGFTSGDDGLFDATPHHRPLDLSLMAWIPWYYGYGIGAQARLNIPIVPDGFIPSLNDEFDIEPSFGVAYANWYGYGYGAVTPAVYAIYAFHLNHNFRVYGGLGLGWDFGVGGCGDACTTYFGGFYWDPVVGLDFKLASSFALRAEVGAQGLKGGVQFYF